MTTVEIFWQNHKKMLDKCAEIMYNVKDVLET